MLEGKVIGRCVPRHRHQEFIRFIATVERSVQAGKVIHAILDNYAAHKHPQVLAWLAEHPRWKFHFTPTSCSRLNAVEGFFSKLTRQSLKRGVLRSVDDLESAIIRYIAATNSNTKPFVWTATTKTIQAKLTLNHPSESVHCVAGLGEGPLRLTLDSLLNVRLARSFRPTKACAPSGGTARAVSI